MCVSPNSGGAGPSQSEEGNRLMCKQQAYLLVKPAPNHPYLLVSMGGWVIANSIVWGTLRLSYILGRRVGERLSPTNPHTHTPAHINFHQAQIFHLPAFWLWPYN